MPLFSKPLFGDFDFPALRSPIDRARVNGIEVRVGDRVRLRPAKRADIFDMVLAGQTAVIQAIEQDMEDNIHVAVLVDDDPGKDLGADLKPGHRFFFAVSEIEPLDV